MFSLAEEVLFTVVRVNVRDQCFRSIQWVGSLRVLETLDIDHDLLHSHKTNS